MLRIVVTICVASHLVTALPQQRPLAQATPNNSPSASTLGSFSPAYTQQLAFGGAPQQSQSAAANPQIRQRGPGSYQSPQPIIISHSPQQTASPATPSAFASFPGAQFAGAGRQILTLRSPSNSQSNDEDEYEYEDDDEPTIQTRPSPTPQRIQPVTRSPIRVASPTPSINSGRFSSQPVQQVRQRQPIPQQVFQSAPQQQQLQQRGQQQQQQISQQQRQAQASPGGFSFDGKRSRLTTPPPIQTVNRYMKQNDDGSMTWGYENEDGTFKEETLGADCVVRGKYGYIDPDGNKREYEYQTGNPCDPNKKDQEEEEEEDLPDGPSRPQQLAGILNARPRPVQRRPQGGQIPQYQGQPQYQLSK